MISKYNSQTDIVLIGAGGHAKTIIETIKAFYPYYNLIGLVDNNTKLLGKDVLEVPIIGNDDILENLYKNGLRKVFLTVGTVGNPIPRKGLYERVKRIGFECVNIIHPTAVVTKHIKMGEGNVIMPGVIINADTQIGSNCIFNTGCIIEHECTIGDNVHVAPGAKLSGQVVIESDSMIGIGACVIQGIKIGKNSMIGAGSVIVEDVPDNAVIVGVPGRIIRKR